MTENLNDARKSRPEGERIKSLQGSLTNTQLANNPKMTPQTVDLYMKQQRKPSVEFICNICSYFNVTSDWLLGLQTTSVDNKQMLKQSLYKRIADLKSNADETTSSIKTLLSSIQELEKFISKELVLLTT